METIIRNYNITSSEAALWVAFEGFDVTKETIIRNYNTNVPVLVPTLATETIIRNYNFYLLLTPLLPNFSGERETIIRNYNAQAV